jgi:hypothetical protein
MRVVILTHCLMNQAFFSGRNKILLSEYRFSFYAVTNSLCSLSRVAVVVIETVLSS